MSPCPLPTIIDDNDNISGIPGPPLGPTKRTTTTSPSTISSERTASMASSSESNTLAGPVMLRTLTPDTLATAPSGAKLPFKIINGPSARLGFSSGMMTF